MKLATAFPVATERGEASAHLVTYWVATKMYLFFQAVIGRGPTKLIPHFWKGWMEIT